MTRATRMFRALRVKPLAAVAFLAAVVYVPGIYSVAGMPRWWVIAIGLPLASTLDLRALWWPITALMAGIVAWAAASVAFAPHPHAAALEAVLVGITCLGAVAASNLDDGIGDVLAGLAGGVAVSAALCVPQTLGWWSPVAQSSVPAGLFYNSEVLAEVAAPLLVWAALSRRWALAIAMAVPVALCHSRVALIAGMVGLLWAWRPRWWVWAGLGCAALAAGYAGLMWFGLSKFASAIDRLGLWITAWYSLTPLGRGIGWWAAAHPGPYEEFAHSDAIQAVIELGPAAALIAAIPALILWRGRGTLGERAAYVAICFEALVSFPLHLPVGAFLGAVLAGGLARRGAVVRAAGLAGRVDGDLAPGRQAA